MNYDIEDRLREHPVALITCDCLRCEAANYIYELRWQLETTQRSLRSAIKLGDDLATVLRSGSDCGWDNAIDAWENAQRVQG